MKKVRIFYLAFFATCIISSLCLCLNADEKRKSLTIKGVVTTGPNKMLDKPARDYGVINGIPLGTLGFSEVGAFNPDGDEPLPLTTDTDDSTLLATMVDPDFVAFWNLDINLLDKSLINVPLQQVKTLISGDNVTRDSLPSIFNSEPFSLSTAEPTNPITLGDWKKARGRAFLKCYKDGNGMINLGMENLIPNRLYTVWGGVISSEKGPFNQPLGGVPSAFVTDSKGRGKFKRILNFCPLDFVDEANAQLGWIMVVLHSDHMAYGGVFSPDVIGLFGGTVAHVHMEFHILGDPVE